MKAAARLKALRLRAGLGVREMAAKLDLPPSTYASYELTFKKTYLPQDLTKAILRILVGLGEPSITEDEVLALGGLVSAGSVKTTGRASNRDLSRNITIAELDATPQAGPGGSMPELDGDGHHRVVGQWSMPSNYLSSFVDQPGAVRILRVTGDSMEPEYPSGERVMVDTSHTVPSPPGVYVLWDGFGLVLKRIEIVLGSEPPRVRITSINPAYAAYERELSEIVINGRVAARWQWR